ncbi:hypothetical protein GCM10009794_00030 [Rothia terrae]
MSIQNILGVAKAALSIVFWLGFNFKLAEIRELIERILRAAIGTGKMANSMLTKVMVKMGVNSI